MSDVKRESDQQHTTPSSDALTRKHRSGVTWLDYAVEFAEETIANGPSGYISAETAEAVAQVLLALVAERPTARSAGERTITPPMPLPLTFLPDDGNFIVDGKGNIVAEIPCQGVENDKAVGHYIVNAVNSTPRSASEAFIPNPSTLWVVWFEDKDHPPEVFFGEGAESSARLRYKQAYDNWSCHLLVRVPTRHHGNSVGPDNVTERVPDRNGHG